VADSEVEREEVVCTIFAVVEDVEIAEVDVVGEVEEFPVVDGAGVAVLLQKTPLLLIAALKPIFGVCLHWRVLLLQVAS
jgi:hypothetical protein